MNMESGEEYENLVDDDEVLVMNFWDGAQDFPTPTTIKTEESSDNDCLSPNQISKTFHDENGITLENHTMCIQDAKANILDDFDCVLHAPEEEYILGVDATPDILAIVKNTQTVDDDPIKFQEPDLDIVILDSDSDNGSISNNSNIIVPIKQTGIVNKDSENKIDGLESEISTTDKNNSLSSIIITNVKSVVEYSENTSTSQVNENAIGEDLKISEANLITADRVLKDSLERKSKIIPKQVFKCEICSFSAKTRFSLSRHVPVHTNINSKFLNNEGLASGNKKLCQSSLKPTNKLVILSQPKDSELPETNIFKCNFCSFSSKIRFALKRHMLTHTYITAEKKSTRPSNLGVMKRRKCKYCSYVAKSNTDLIGHVKLHKNMKNNVNIYQCKYCSFVAKNNTGLVHHVRLLHKNIAKKLHVCQKCDFKTAVKTIYLQHLKRNESLTHCFKAGLQNNDNIALNNLTSTRKDNQTLSKFEMSRNKPLLSGTLKRKLKLKNKKIVLDQNRSETSPAYQCDYCSYSSNSKVQLNKHTFLHTTFNQSIYRCKECNYKATKMALARHISTFHKGIKYSTSIKKNTRNGKDCRKTDSLNVSKVKKITKVIPKSKIHKTETVQIKKNNENLDLNKDESNRNGNTDSSPKFQCKYCSHTTRLKVNLNTHLRLHTKYNKPIYSCKECNYKATRMALSRHVNDAHRGKKYKFSNQVDENVQVSGNQKNQIYQNRHSVQAYDTTNSGKALGNQLSVKKNWSTLTGKSSEYSSIGELIGLKNDNLQLLEKKTNITSMELNTFLYVCEICGYVTDQKETLIIHKLKHSTSALTTTENKTNCFELKCNTEKLTNNVVPTSETRAFPDNTSDSFRDGQERMGILLKNNGRQCSACKRIFKNLAGFTNHKCYSESEFNKLVTYKGLRYTCKVCQFSSHLKQRVKAHLLVHKSFEEAAIHKCFKCGYRTKYKYYLGIHKLKCCSELGPQKSAEVMKYNCDTCNFKTNSHRDIRSHNLTYHRIPLICDICGYETIFSAGMVNHKKYMHKLQVNEDDKNGNEIKYKCDDCDFQTNYKHNLQNHKILHININEVRVYKNRTYNVKIKTDNRHLDKSLPIKSSKPKKNHNKLFSCNTCSFSTNTQVNLYRHHYIHKHKQEGLIYKCDVCTYKTVIPANLTRHKRMHHTSQTYYCDLCPYQCHVKGYLSRHKQMQHSKQDATINKKLLNDCSQQTSTDMETSKHNEEKHGESIKPSIQFSCKYCEYRTKIRFKLKKHIEKMHSKNLQVTKSIGLSKATNTKIFKCSSCPFQTKYKHSLDKHLETRHPEAIRLSKSQRYI